MQCLHSSRGLDARHFFAVLSLFSEVHVLCVDGGPWRFDQVSLILRLPVVHGLVLRLVLWALEETDCATAFYESLQSSGSLGASLKSIRSTSFTREEVEAFFGYTPNAGPHLVDLELDIYYAKNDSPGKFSSKSCHRVRSHIIHRTPGHLGVAHARLRLLRRDADILVDFEDDDQSAWVCLEVARTCSRFYTHPFSSHHRVRRTLPIVTSQLGVSDCSAQILTTHSPRTLLRQIHTMRCRLPSVHTSFAHLPET